MIQHAPRLRISIIIPCFNRAGFIRAAIDSALGQQNDSIEVEVIVIDDGSQDASWDEISKYGKRITAIRTENRGVSLARNLGLEKSTCDWVKFLDSDDLLLEGALASQAAQLRVSGPDVVVVGKLSTNRQSQSRGTAAFAEGRLIPSLELSTKSIQVSQPLFPRKGLVQIGGFRSGSIGEDYELVMRLAVAGWRFLEFDLPVVYFRDSDDEHRLSANLSSRRFDEALHMYQRVLLCAFESTHVDRQVFLMGIAEASWSMGRRATRLGHYTVAARLFDLAISTKVPFRKKAEFPLRQLYSVCNPVLAERIAESFKRFMGRR